MKSAAHIIALYLQQQGVGTLGGSIFINGEPATPDNTLTIYDTPSDRPRHIGGLENTGYRRQKWRVQVRARHRNAQEAHEWLQQVRVVLHTLTDFISNSSPLMAQNAKGAWLLSGGISIGRDADNRSLAVDNWEVDIAWLERVWNGGRITENGGLRMAEDGDRVRVIESDQAPPNLDGVWQEVTIQPQWLGGHDGTAWGWYSEDFASPEPCIQPPNEGFGELIDDSEWLWGEIMGVAIRPVTQSGVRRWVLVEFIVRSASNYGYDANNNDSRVIISGAASTTDDRSGGGRLLRRCGDIVRSSSYVRPVTAQDLDFLAPTTFRVRFYRRN